MSDGRRFLEGSKRVWGRERPIRRPTTLSRHIALHQADIGRHGAQDSSAGTVSEWHFAPTHTGDLPQNYGEITHIGSLFPGLGRFPLTRKEFAPVRDGGMQIASSN